MLSSGHPMLIWWGAERIQLYNDAHAPALQPDRHPATLGQPGAQAWPEGWETLSPQIETVLSGQGPVWHEHYPIPRTRENRLETSHWTYSLNPIQDPASPGGIGGVLLIGVETTETVRALRRTERNAAQMRAIFETSHQFLCLLDTDGTVLDANPASLLAINATLPEVLGKKFWTTLWFAHSPGMAEQIAAEIPRAAAGEDVRHEIQLHVAGGWRAFDLSLRPVRNADGGGRRHPVRGHRTHRMARSRGKIPPCPENGSRRPAHRRAGARLQQPTDRHLRQPGHAQNPPLPGPPRRGRALYRRRRSLRQPRRRPHPPAAGLFPQADARPQADRHQRPHHRHGKPHPARRSARASSSGSDYSKTYGPFAAMPASWRTPSSTSASTPATPCRMAAGSPSQPKTSSSPPLGPRAGA